MTPKTALGATFLAAQALLAPSCSEQQNQAVKGFMTPETATYIDQPDRTHVDVTTYHPHADIHVALADSSVQKKDNFDGHMSAPIAYKALDGFEKNLVNMGVAQTIKTPYVAPKVIDLGKEITGLFHTVQPLQKTTAPKAK